MPELPERLREAGKRRGTIERLPVVQGTFNCCLNEWRKTKRAALLPDCQECPTLLPLGSEVAKSARNAPVDELAF